MDESIFNQILNEIVHEECVDINFSIRSGLFTLEKILEQVVIVEKITEVVSKKTTAVAKVTAKTNGNTSSSSVSSSRQNQNNVYCPICNFAISGKRFAPHLEKCLRGGKRGSKNSVSSSSSSSSSYATSLPYVNIRPKKLFVDPYPDSLVIKIKLRNGAPRPNLTREGVSLQHFLDSQLQLVQQKEDEKESKEEIQGNEIEQKQDEEVEVEVELTIPEHVQNISCYNNNSDMINNITHYDDDNDGYPTSQTIHHNCNSSGNSGDDVTTNAIFSMDDENSKSPYTTIGLSASTSTRTSLCGDEDDNMADINIALNNHSIHFQLSKSNNNNIDDNQQYPFSINSQNDIQNGKSYNGHHNGKKRTKIKQTPVEVSFPS